MHTSVYVLVILYFSFPLFIPVKLFIGFGFPYEGPAPLEAIANGCIFLQPKFNPPHSSLNHNFFRGKPTSRKVDRLIIILAIRMMAIDIFKQLINLTTIFDLDSMCFNCDCVPCIPPLGSLSASLRRAVYWQTSCHYHRLQ